ncbi:hypothetical protein Val02_82330 [Virgisporangium aliadipatigenens]|uniref:DUF397 domain-containing protein n=1 Tax=Virgisporangium aliadipatigenens TaxID=741659 RepID=A0A8J3YVC0_9ACTN|nr:DUF397 domain-containing protein [Virgisporangium aliadipatigenens]GIJ51347.1 hypothetical protein Val02_82330 [Virgisporangium aliadipatigenens]
MKPTPWKKSSRSGSNGGSCVEIRRNGALMEFRDSKDPGGPVLPFPPEAFAAWLAGVKAGEFDLDPS